MVLAKLKEKEHWTVEEYLEFEKTSPVRHEYVEGQIYAMAGGTKNHNRITVDLTARLNDQLASGGCEAFASDVKVRVGTLFYYPDVVVTCEPLTEAENEDDYIAKNPVLITEVLSKTTARTDRVEKMNEYQHLPSLREYVLIAQERMRVEVYRHEQAGAAWQSEVYTEPEAEVFFASVGAKIKVADIYRRVKFAAPETEEE
jgi:Uma2 family endonuclease